MKEYNYIKWDYKYTTPIEIINEGNKQFVKTYNHLLDAIKNNTCSNEIMQILYSLLHYTEHHLINEEILYNNHPSLQKHKIKHSEFVDKIKSAIAKYETTLQSQICDDLLNFMKNWFENHILKQDIELIKNL